MHKFHFKVDPELKKLLKKSAANMNMTISRFVRYVFVQAGDYLEKTLYSGKDNGSIWIECNAEADLYVWINEEDYRWVKHLHQALNIYSMAQILRTMVERFIDLLNRYGLTKLLGMIRRFQEKWRERMEKCSWTGVDLSYMCQILKNYTTTLSPKSDILRIKRHPPQKR